MHTTLRPFILILASTWMGCAGQPEPAKSESPLQVAYDTLASRSAGRIQVDLSAPWALPLASMATERYLDVINFTGRRVHLDKQWSWDDARGCGDLLVEPDVRAVDEAATDEVRDLTLEQALQFKAQDGEIPSLADLTGLSTYEVNLVVDGESIGYRGLALAYRGRPEPLLLDPVVWGVNGLETQKLCAPGAAAPAEGDGVRRGNATCTAKTVTAYSTLMKDTNTSGHNSTTTAKCVGSVQFKFTQTCATNCALTVGPSIVSKTCTADDGYWNSFEATDSKSDLHGCSSSLGKSCTAYAGYSCVTRHCAFPCTATASLTFNGFGYTVGAGNGHLNTNQQWPHQSISCP